jgi:hypothetical protein
MGMWMGIIRKTACYEVKARRLEAKLGPKCTKPLNRVRLKLLSRESKKATEVNPRPAKKEDNKTKI